MTISNDSDPGHPVTMAEALRQLDNELIGCKEFEEFCYLWRTNCFRFSDEGLAPANSHADRNNLERLKSNKYCGPQ
jgi:hypothetical protein